MARSLPARNYRKGRWLNGLGLSWDIAAEPENAGANDFGWRLALAQIDANVAFSHYAGVDRIFTLIEGEGLDLIFNGRDVLKVDRCFVPHEFPGDIETACVLKGGPCRALNLFLRRQAWQASVRVLPFYDDLRIAPGQTALAVALRGSFKLSSGGTLDCGDTLHLSRGDSAALEPQSGDALLYVAALTPVQ